MNYDHLRTTVGRPFPKAWIVGKTLAQVTNKGKNPELYMGKTIETVEVSSVCDSCNKEHRTFRDREQCDRQSTAN